MTDPLKEKEAFASELKVESTELGTRLDVWLHERFPDLSRGTLRRWIKEGHVQVDGKTTKPTHKPKSGETISVVPPAPRPMELIPKDRPLDILYEDTDLLVINKPPGLVVHPAAGHEEDTLVHALLHHCRGELSGIGGVARPGIVHRLDQDTSGCMVVAKNDQTHQGLARQFANRNTSKTYLAIHCGVLKPVSGTINAPIARHPVHRKEMAVVDHGRPAKTDYRVVQNFGDIASFTEIKIHTGRTHQIRVHFKHLGYPVFGDVIYGKRSTIRLGNSIDLEPQRQMLHAWKLTFQHPVKNKPCTYSAPLPEDFKSVLNRLASATGETLQEI